MFNNMEYELPIMKEEESNLNKKLTEMKSRRKECLNLSKSSKNIYKEKCKEMKLEGINLEKEIREYGMNIYDDVQEILNTINYDKLNEIIKFYKDFTIEVHNIKIENEFLNVLHKMIQNDNITFLEDNEINKYYKEKYIDFKTGSKQISEHKNNKNKIEIEINENDIDWDFDITEEPELNVNN